MNSNYGGAPMSALAVSASGPHIVIATYQDGSIQSFKVGGGTVITLCPPLTISEAELDRAFGMLEDAVAEVVGR